MPEAKVLYFVRPKAKPPVARTSPWHGQEHFNITENEQIVRDQFRDLLAGIWPDRK